MKEGERERGRKENREEKRKERVETIAGNDDH